MSKLKIGRREFPFKVTETLKELVKSAHVNIDLVKEKKPRESKRFAFLATKAACAADGEEFAYTFEEFMNFVEPECADKAAKLALQLSPAKKAKTKRRRVAKETTTKKAGKKQPDAAAKEKADQATAPESE